MNYEFIQFLNESVVNYLPKTWKRIGDKLHGRCPICGDSHKSVTKARGWYYLKNASYHCFNCGANLSGLKLLEVLSGKEYSEIKREFMKLFLKSGANSSLSSYYQENPTEPNIFQVKQMVKPEWKRELSESAKEYLKNRMVLDAPYYVNNLYSYISKKNQEYILIDWVLNGVSAYFQLNDFQKHGSIKYIFPKNSRKLVYGLDNIDINFPYIFVFEGFYDSLFVKNGICTGTKSLNDYQLKIIKERYPEHQIVISFDNDVPGIKAMLETMNKPHDFKYFKWFDANTKQKDINDYILAKKNVNIFTDEEFLKSMICDKLVMKLHLIKNNLIPKNDPNPQRKTRKIQ